MRNFHSNKKVVTLLQNKKAWRLKHGLNLDPERMRGQREKTVEERDLPVSVLQLDDTAEPLLPKELFFRYQPDSTSYTHTHRK